MLDGLQEREPGAPGGPPDLGEVHRGGGLPRRAAQLPGDPLQPLREPTLCSRLPCHRHVPARRRHRGIRQRRLHRLQGLPPGLSLRRHPHRPGHGHRRQVPLLRPPCGERHRAGVRGRLSHPRHHRGRHGRSGQRDLPCAGEQRRDRPQARAGHGPQALLHRGTRRGPPPNGHRAHPGGRHVERGPRRPWAAPQPGLRRRGRLRGGPQCARPARHRRP